MREDGLSREAEQPVLDKIPEPYQFTQSSNQAFYFINSVSVHNNPLDSDDIIIAYNDNVIVGARFWNGEYTDIPVMGIDKYNMEGTAGYSDEGDNITFKVMDASSGVLVEMFSDVELKWGNMGVQVANLVDDLMPLQMSLDSAYPNPFNPTTTLNFTLPIEATVSISVYDLQGRDVATLVNGKMLPGSHSVKWNADSYSSGMYFVKMESNEFISTQKLMLVK